MFICIAKLKLRIFMRTFYICIIYYLLFLWNAFIVKAPTIMTCIDFDNGWNGFVGSKWAYFKDVKIDRVIDTASRGHSAKFTKGSRLEFPSLANRYNVFRSFAVSFWYKRTDGQDVSYTTH